MATIIRAFLLILVLVLLARLLVSARRRRDMFRARLRRYPHGRVENGRGVSMVQDPQCGRFVARASSLTVSDGGEELYFCSRECRDRHVRRRSVYVIGPRSPPRTPPMA